MYLLEQIVGFKEKKEEFLIHSIGVKELVAHRTDVSKKDVWERRWALRRKQEGKLDIKMLKFIPPFHTLLFLSPINQMPSQDFCLHDCDDWLYLNIFPDSDGTLRLFKVRGQKVLSWGQQTIFKCVCVCVRRRANVAVQLPKKKFQMLWNLCLLGILCVCQ